MPDVARIGCAFGINPNGEPDIWFGKFLFREQDQDTDEDLHHDAILAAATYDGYEVLMVCDDRDPAGAVVQLCCDDTYPLLDARDLAYFTANIGAVMPQAYLSADENISTSTPPT